MEYPNYALILIQEAVNLLNELALEARLVPRNSQDDSEVCFHIQQVKHHIAEARIIAGRMPQVEQEPKRIFCCRCNEDITEGTESERYFKACADCIASAKSEPEVVLDELLG